MTLRLHDDIPWWPAKTPMTSGYNSITINGYTLTVGDHYLGKRINGTKTILAIIALEETDEKLFVKLHKTHTTRGSDTCYDFKSIHRVDDFINYLLEAKFTLIT